MSLCTRDVHRSNPLNKPGAALAFAVTILLPSRALAGGDGVPVEFIVGNLWVLMATALVFIMHLGFATLEAGLTQEKNTVNILFKNVCVVSMGILLYAVIGFSLMYPGEEFAGRVFGFTKFGLELPENGLTQDYNPHYTYWTDFIFQAMFAATAVTIVSGALAERVRIETFLLFAFFYLAFCYPIVGMWKWGGGFLDKLDTPFYDFAGSTIVHSVGGWAALIGSIMVGPRLAKYEGNTINSLGPSSMPLATIGVFLLWFGWFGFNGGSVLSADPGDVSRVFVITSIGGAAGIMGAMVGTIWMIKHLDLSMLLNGALAGLVAITAGADQFGLFDAALIGLIAGLMVVAAVLFFDRKVRVDDPVGAISVHLVCGVWGTLAVGLFGNLASQEQFFSQVYGVVCVGAFCSGFSFLVFFSMNKLIGLRVSEEVELAGLDMHEHGISGYRGLRDVTPPNVALLSPAYGATVSGMIEVLADASDDRGVAGVRFTLDGEELGDHMSAPPYCLRWNTAEIADGAHVLTAVAWDAAGNHGASVPFKIKVENQAKSDDEAVPS